ncbi:MAG: transporter [Actinomycetota bacterium]|uniref:Transporter n=1 Tax=Mycobacterium lentiflavum TaxID=141349 RepID=A0ABY3UXX7_MYCLN|nr:transporter [Mycobacterium lentiflavum]MEE3063235.1 transporter [Actinomycetota bacterium]ULP44411.1 transporter [Mycobacterium lentiflavum]
MNSSTLVGSLIFAAVLVVVIAVVIQMMMLGWRRRARRQDELIGDLPGVPDVVGPATTTLRGVYLGCTLAPEWNERITSGDLGYRSRAVLSRYPEGILLERSRANPIWIPQQEITEIRTERGMVGKVGARNSILAIRWRLPAGVEVDIGFRAGNRDEYDGWLEEAA